MTTTTKELSVSLLSSTSKHYLLTYLCHFSSLHGATPVYYKHYILWQLLQITWGKEMYKVTIHDLKPKEGQKNELKIH